MRVKDFNIILLLPSCVQLYLFVHHLHFAMADTLISRRPNRKLEMLGDINLGAIMSMSMIDSQNDVCKETLYSPIFIHLPLAMEYMVNELNREKTLPRNLKLGLVVLDNCYSVSQTIVQAFNFLPQNRCRDDERPPGAHKAYDVVGVMGSTTVETTKFMTRVLSTGEIPVISYRTRNDELSNKNIFPYFFRTTTTGSDLFGNFATLIQSENWEYISLVYERDYSGIFKITALLEKIKKVSCLATLESGTMHSNEKEIDRIVRALNKTSEARVVVLLTSRPLTHKVISATAKLADVPPGYFIWVDLAGWLQEVEYMKDLGNLLWGTLALTDYCQQDVAFHQHFLNLLSKTNSTQVPWFQDFWENYVLCSFTNSTCNSSLQGFVHYAQAGRALDAVHMFAKAISRLLESEKCINMTATKTKTDRECITGPELRNELLNTSFQGHCEWLHIDEYGNRNTSYQLVQVLPGKGDASFDIVPVVRMLNTGFNRTRKITWEYHWLPAGKTFPESSCSVPCSERQAKILQETRCCWLCQDCRDNEYFINNRSQCVTCPEFTWPDVATNYSSCREIPPSVPSPSSTRSLLFIFLAAFFTIICISVCIFFIRHKNSRIIKASSTMLSFLMLFAIFLGNVTIIMLRLYPNDVLCRFIFLFFCTSFSLLYGALLTRAFVIYRIFTQSFKSARKPSMTSHKAQIKICAGLMFVQLLLCAGTLTFYNTWVKKTMTDVTVEFVELTCSFPLIGLTLFLAYNIIMLSLCSYLAYKTRNLPSNYNETFYIATCVFTTLLIWFALSPSYYITTKQYIQMLILIFAVSINHLVAIICLFLPKVYVIMVVSDHFVTRFYSRSSYTSGSTATNSSVGSQDFMSIDKKKKRQSLQTTHESLEDVSQRFPTQQIESIKVSEEPSESDVDLPSEPSQPSAPNKRRHLEGTKMPKTPSKPTEPSQVNESTVSSTPALPTSLIHTILQKAIWSSAPTKELNSSFSDSNVNVEDDMQSVSGANYESGDYSSGGVSGSGVNADQE